MACKTGSSTFCYTGNQVGNCGYVGDGNHVSGGDSTSGISAGRLIEVFVPELGGRRPYLNGDPIFNQTLLDASYPELDLIWFADITLNDGTLFRVSDRNVYIQDEDGIPRFYEARAVAPKKIIRTLGEWLKKGFEIGEASLEVDNFDGLFNKYLSNGTDRINWANTSIVIKLGFGEKYDNYNVIYDGYVSFKNGLQDDDGTLRFKLYEKYQIDQKTVPTRTFNNSYFPFIGDEDGGRVPIVYGDWTEDVDVYGQISGTCIDKLDVLSDFVTFKISDGALASITEVYLERGENAVTGSRSPILLDMNLLTFDLGSGEIKIPKNVDLLQEEIIVVEADFAVAGSGVNVVFSNINYLTSGVQIGDIVLKISTNERAIVTSVATSQLTLSGGVDFSAQVEYRILSKSYVFVDDDALRIKCIGKPTNLTDYLRLGSLSTPLLEPQGNVVDFSGNYYIADDDTAAIYKIRFSDKTITATYPYSNFDVGFVACGGMVLQTDEYSLWAVDRTQGKIYFYNLKDDQLEASFSLQDVLGIAVGSTDLRGIGQDNLQRLWVGDNINRVIYEIDPFPTSDPVLISSLPYDTIQLGLNGLTGLVYDRFNNVLATINNIDKELYEFDTAGVISKTFTYEDLYLDITDLSSISIAQDGSWFLTDKASDVLYNFIPYDDTLTNPAFQAKDLLQTYSGRTYSDFSINWNYIGSQQLNIYKSRFVLDSDTPLVDFTNAILEQFNCELYLDKDQYNLFFNEFDNYKNDGYLITERDIVLGSFNPKKETKQYFNSADSLYRFWPASNRSKRGKTITSVEAVEFSKQEVARTFKLSAVYQEADANRIIATRIRQSAPEPEVISMKLTFRSILLQPSDFVRILYADGTGGFCDWESSKSQRRLTSTPGYVRQVIYDLQNMTIQAKIWSLADTQFGDYQVEGPVIGGESGDLALVAVGKAGYISPNGYITGSTLNTLTISDVDGDDAETREDVNAGKAWEVGYKIALIDALDSETKQVNEIASISGQIITFVDDWTITIDNTVESTTGLPIEGHFIGYADYIDVTTEQKDLFSSISLPIVNYPQTVSIELAELINGDYNFDDGTSPYIIGDKALLT